MKITNENSAHDDNNYKMIDESIDGLECSLDVCKKKKFIKYNGNWRNRSSKINLDSLFIKLFRRNRNRLKD